MTLDKDDVALAFEWLRRPAEWRSGGSIAEYEMQFARWNGSRYAFSFMGGRVALSAAIAALELQPGDEVILPGYTCVVVPNAFHFAGIKTVYADIELETYGLDVGQVQRKITPRTRAILIQHLYGLVCRDYQSLLSLASTNHLKVIEDCAQATGAMYNGIKIGNLGDVAFYSSEQSKIFNTVQGGIATTNDESLARRLKAFYDAAPFPDGIRVDKLLHNLILNYHQSKDPSKWWRYEWAEFAYGSKRLIGITSEEQQNIRPAEYGCKMPAPLAAIGVNQLRKVDSYNQRRIKAAAEWNAWCDENHYWPPLVVTGSIPVYLRYPVLVDPQKKQDGRWANRTLGVELGRWFVSQTHPVNAHIAECPNAERAVRECVNLPTLLS
jgi:dTDP-4-amino-4,6-dideoxygalactose transaminase